MLKMMAKIKILYGKIVEYQFVELLRKSGGDFLMNDLE